MLLWYFVMECALHCHEQTCWQPCLVLAYLLKTWESEFDEALLNGDEDGMLSIARLAMTTFLGHGGGLLGEEVVNADLRRTLELKREMEGPGATHVTVALRAKVKGETWMASKNGCEAALKLTDSICHSCSSFRH